MKIEDIAIGRILEEHRIQNGDVKYFLISSIEENKKIHIYSLQTKRILDITLTFEEIVCGNEYFFWSIL